MEESLDHGVGRAISGVLGEVVLKAAFEGASMEDQEVWRWWDIAVEVLLQL